MVFGLIIGIFFWAVVWLFWLLLDSVLLAMVLAAILLIVILEISTRGPK